MLSWVPARFEREMGCTEAELRAWLPGASGEHAVALEPGGARVALQAGALHLRWQTLAPRRIALLRLPRLAVSFDFEGVDAAARAAYMRRFDLYTHRGGG